MSQKISCWTRINLELLTPGPIGILYSALSSVVTALKSVLTVLQTLIKTAKVFYSSAVNPFATLLGKLLQSIEDMIADFFSSGLYSLFVAPKEGYTSSVKKDAWGIPSLTPGEAINMAVRSFDDPGDLERPLFSDSATVGAIGLMLTLPTFASFSSAFDTFNDMLDYGKIKKACDSLKVKVKSKNTRLVRAVRISSYLNIFERTAGSWITDGFVVGDKITTSSDNNPGPYTITALTAKIMTVDVTLKIEERYVYVRRGNDFKHENPDWDSLTLRQIVVFADLENTLLDLMSTVRGWYIAENKALKQILDSILAKVTELQKRITYLYNVMEKLSKTMSSDGLYILKVPPSTGGNAYLKKCLRDSYLESLKTSTFTFMWLLVSGGPSIAGITALQKFIK